MSIYFKYKVDASGNQIFIPLETVFKTGAVQEPYFYGMPAFLAKTRTIENQNTCGFIDVSNNDISTKYACHFIEYEYTADTGILASRNNIVPPSGCSKMKVFMTGASGSGGTGDTWYADDILTGGGAGGSGGLLYFEILTPTSTYSLYVGKGGVTAGQDGTNTTFTTQGFTNTCVSGQGAYNYDPTYPYAENYGGEHGFNTVTFGNNIISLTGYRGADGNPNNTGASSCLSAYQQNGIYNGSFYPANLTYSGTGGRGSNVSSSGTNWAPGQNGRVIVYFEF